MATADEYASWIVANADKKGTPEFETVAKAYEDAKSSQFRSVSKQTESQGITKEGIIRGAKLGLRDIVSGALALPALASDVATMPIANIYNTGRKIYNKVTGETGGTVPLIGRTSKQIENVMTSAGFPMAETPTERVLSAATKGAAGVATGIGASGQLQNVASPIAKKFAELLNTNPGNQMLVGAASPAAGQMVKESGGGPVAQFGTELGTALALGSIPSLAASKKQVPTVDELKSASSAAYKAAEKAGAVFKPAAYDRFFSSLVSDVKKAAFDAGLHPKVAAVLSRLDAEQGNTQTLENMEILRRIVKSAATSQDKDERRIAGLVQEKLDDFVSNAGPDDIMAGNAPVAISELKNARKLWSQASKSDAIETLIDRAKLSAPNFSASGMENALRTEFRAMAKNPNRMRLFTSDEQDAIRKVAMGGPVENTLRMLGKFAPTGVVSGALSSGTGALFGGGVGAVALPATGFLARQGATALTKRNADMAAALMRGGRLASQPGFDKDKLAAALAAMNAANANAE